MTDVIINFKELKINTIIKLELMLDTDQINNLYNKRNIIN